VAFNKDQWIASFEGQLAILRPHLTERVRASISAAAWHRRGRKDQDPIEAAKEESKALDADQVRTKQVARLRRPSTKG